MHKVTLGKAPDKESGVSSLVKAETTDERLATLEAKVEMLLQAIGPLEELEKKRQVQAEATTMSAEIASVATDPNVNRDGIPLNQNLIGTTRGVPYVLTVRPDAYYVGVRPYPTLSAAAKAVSGVRRSGWIFWRLPDGRTAKEAFKK